MTDSGPLIALFNARDAWHAQVIDWLKRNPQARLISTWAVATEVCALLARRVSNAAALDFLRWIERGGLELDTPQPGVSLREVLQVSLRFADLPFDLADASVAEAATRLGIRHVLSIDTDFDIYRDRSGRPLIRVPELT
ncbi:MAG: type II toxin-antitoxin system VapC family toxin [Rubrivivax sp.]